MHRETSLPQQWGRGSRGRTGSKAVRLHFHLGLGLVAVIGVDVYIHICGTCTWAGLYVRVTSRGRRCCGRGCGHGHDSRPGCRYGGRAGEEDDVNSRMPRRHEEMFSNYAASKIKAERLVRAADRTPLAGSAEGRMGRGRARPQLLRTGCLRPGNGIFGTGGDILCGAYLARQVNPSWAHDSLQNFIYVENASLAHFCYERRLIEKAQGSPNPDIGGQAFGIVDAGPPLTCGDVYTVLTTLTDGRTVFPRLSATAMFALAHVLEGLYLLRSFAASSSNPFLRRLGQFVPAPTGDLVNLQPSLFFLTMVHLIWDDSRARTPPERGGLGYEPQWTTLAALCKLVAEHKKANGRFEARSMSGGISLGFGLASASRRVEKVIENFATDVTLLDE